MWFFVISRDLLYFLVVFRDFVTWSELAVVRGYCLCDSSQYCLWLFFCDLFVIFVISHNILWLRLNSLVERGGELESEKLVRSSQLLLFCWSMTQMSRNNLNFDITEHMTSKHLKGINEKRALNTQPYWNTSLCNCRCAGLRNTEI